MPKGVWIKDGSRAIPADERSLEFLLSIKGGVPFMANTSTARNPRQHSLWWVLCRMVGEQLEKTEYQMSDAALITLGRCRTEITPAGREYVKVESIAFESMPQEEFNNLFQATVNLFAGWLGSAPKEVMDAFNEKVSDKRYAGMRR